MMMILETNIDMRARDNAYRMTKDETLYSTGLHLMASARPL